MFEKVNSSTWINDNNTTIWFDDFGIYHVTTEDGEFEVAATFEKAIKLAKKLEQL